MSRRQKNATMSTRPDLYFDRAVHLRPENSLHIFRADVLFGGQFVGLNCLYMSADDTLPYTSIAFLRDSIRNPPTGISKIAALPSKRSKNTVWFLLQFS